MNDVGFPDRLDDGRPVVASPRRQQHETAMEIDHSHYPMFPPSYSFTTFNRSGVDSSTRAETVQIDSPPQSETSRTTLPLNVFSVDAAQTPLNLTARSRSVSPGCHSGLVIGSNAGETPLDVSVNRRSASLDTFERKFILSPVTRAYPYEDEATMPVGNVTDDSRHHFYVPTQRSPPLKISNDALWKLIALKFGDSETNAAFANDAANANANYNVDGALIPAGRIKVEPEESLVENIDGQPDVEEAPTIFEDPRVNVVGDWQNNLAAVNGAGRRYPYEHYQYSVENSDEVPLRQFNGEAHSSGSYSPSPPDAFERNQLTHALHYGIHLVDAQYTDVNRSLRHGHSEPRDYGSHSIYKPQHRNLINEDDVLQDEGGLSTVASNSAAQINPSYVPVAELPPEPSPEIDPCYIDVADLSPPFAPARGWYPRA